MPIFNFDAAILRKPGKSVSGGLRAGAGDNPGFDGVAAEHDAYAAALKSAGVELIMLPALEAFPDSIFVEDPALVFEKHAILLRPGAESRRGEAGEIAAALHDHFQNILELPVPGFVEGGDILQTPGKVMIGLSARTDEAGARGLQRLLAEIGRKGEIVNTPEGVLHFKSDCALLDEETILSTKRLAASGVFDGFDIIETPAGEEAAANALRINDIVMLGDGFPRTAELLDKRGYKIVLLQTSQIGKIDAGLSCMSLRRQGAKI